MQKSIFPQKVQKSLCITTKSLYSNSKFQTQLSRKLQRFRTCRKNKKCSIFHDLPEYIIFSYGCKLLDWSFKRLSLSPYGIILSLVAKPQSVFTNLSLLNRSSIAQRLTVLARHRQLGKISI